MNNYIGKICPYCKSAIKEDDEIVVCSTCEMPHHKDCWIDNQGCTTFGCTGTISSPSQNSINNSEDDFEIELYDDSFPETDQNIYCTKCGTPNKSGCSFCFKCGNALVQNSTAQLTFNTAHSNYTSGNNDGIDCQDNDLPLLLGSNAEYYLEKSKYLNSHNQKTSWNWSAFLFAPFWLLYRKMYLYGAISLGGMLLISLLRNWVGFILSMSVFIALGLFGNFIYIDFITKKAAQAKMISAQEKSSYIAKYSGTNITIAVLCAIGFTVLTTIIQIV